MYTVISTIPKTQTMRTAVVVLFLFSKYAHGLETSSVSMCHGVSNYQTLRNPFNYHFYWICMDGEAYEHNCGLYKRFNEVTGTCDVHNARGVHELQTNHNGCPMENDINNIVTFPSPYDCAAYYICYRGEMKPFRCLEDLHWNKAIQKCDFPQNAECPLAKIVCPNEPGVHIFPHPFDCTMFFFCLDLKPVLRQCPPDLQFDPAYRQCNFPDRFECLLQ